MQERGKAGSALARAPSPLGGEGGGGRRAAGACGTCSSRVGGHGAERCYSDTKIPALGLATSLAEGSPTFTPTFSLRADPILH